MNYFVLQSVVWSAFLTTVLTIVFDANDNKKLPESLQKYKNDMQNKVVERCKKSLFETVFRRLGVFGYLLTLILLSFSVSYTEWFYLLFSIIWTIISVADAPHILSKKAVFSYELSLMLNGALLAILFLL